MTGLRDRFGDDLLWLTPPGYGDWFSRRGMRDTRRRLWCSWGATSSTRRLYFGGDSGYGLGFAEIGAREGPFDVAILPIGAYEPRWFMASSHMTPEEAARAAIDVGATAVVEVRSGSPGFDFPGD